MQPPGPKETNSSGGGASDGNATSDSASLIRAAHKAALATLDRATGYPYASLVTVATEAGGRPLLLLSNLARHTRNLAADPRSSLLFEPAGTGPADPLAGARVTAIGNLAPLDPHDVGYTAAMDRFVARHESAVAYAQFGDFRLFAMEIEVAHFIGGFGRIVEITGSALNARLAGDGAA